MKRLSEYIKESIFDIEDNWNIDKHIKDEIQEFLKANYKIRQYSISERPNDGGKYVVDSKESVYVKNKRMIHLTNDMFVWGEVEGNFVCSYGKSLTSLVGAPEKVGEMFDCRWCNSLASLVGAPKEVGGKFTCFDCNSLISLEGSPKKVGKNFDCSWCNSLISLEGAPKEVSGDFYCYGGDAKFTEDDVRKVTNVKGKIEC